MEDAAARTLLQEYSDAAGIDLVHYGTEATDAEIRDTAIAQPLLVAASLLAYNTLGITPGMTAGHSVGEFAAAAIAGVMPGRDAVLLVRERGLAMADASAVQPTSMTAVVGGDASEVLAAIDAAGLTAANNNGKGQIVAAGTVEQLAALEAPRRARLFPLSVAGAFHTEHMAPAQDRLRAKSLELLTQDPTLPLLTNYDGSTVAAGGTYMEHLVAQVARPVRWDLCMETMQAAGITGMLELTPAGTLTGIAKRNLPGVELFNLSTPDQLDEARDFAARHQGKAQ